MPRRKTHALTTASEENASVIATNTPTGPGMRQLEGVPGSDQWGSISFGGPIVTAGGLVFIGATMDDYFRAYDVESGEELWRYRLPAGGQATPMVYMIDDRQYVVIAAGGHATFGTTLGDYVVAFALP